ncbi:hypothetical protein LCGC14_1631190 [marine sediment metagenome]|uniref:DUF5658 domain-containing protein n=1 Tax=marine sediment metagenome TaxID=412755 RepID=A0A0F9I2T7_9ZZZZ
MHEIIWLWALFLILNILDGFTTWLSIYKLPPELKGEEANPLFKDVEKQFFGSMVRKAVLVFLGLWVFLYLYNNNPIGGAFVFRVLNLVLLLAVLNNLYVYVSRRVKQRKTQTPVGLMHVLLNKLRVPKKVSRILAYYLVAGILVVASYFITAVTI